MKEVSESRHLRLQEMRGEKGARVLSLMLSDRGDLPPRRRHAQQTRDRRKLNILPVMTYLTTSPGPSRASTDVAAHTSMIGSRWAQAFQVPAENCRVVCAPTVDEAGRPAATGARSNLRTPSIISVDTENWPPAVLHRLHARVGRGQLLVYCIC